MKITDLSRKTKLNAKADTLMLKHVSIPGNYPQNLVYNEC